MKIPRREVFVAALGIAAATAGGCADGTESSVGELSDSPAFESGFQQTLVDSDDLLGRIALSPKHALEFYGVGKAVLVSETGVAQTAVPAMAEGDQTLEPIQLIQKLAPGTPIPTRLHAFLDDVRKGVTPKIPPLPPSNRVKPVTQPLYQNYDQTGFGPPGHCPFTWFYQQSSTAGKFCPSGHDEDFCQADLTWNFVDRLHWDTIRYTAATVCVDSGVSPFIITFSGDGGTEVHSFDQPAGTWRQVAVASHKGILTTDTVHIMYDVKPGGVYQFGGYITYE